MVSIRGKNATFKVPLILGGIGVAIHLLFLRWIVYRDYQPPVDQSFVNSFLVNATLSFLGGLFYALLLKRPVSQTVRARRISLSALFKGGLWGIVATFAAFQGLYLGAACFLTWKMKVGVPEGSLRTAFLLAIMEIETYGLFVIFYFLIPAFVSGILVTAVVARSFFQRASGRAS